MFTVGVEEEYHLVDAETMALRSAGDLVASACERTEDMSAEISTSQLDVATPVCSTLGAHAAAGRPVPDLRPEVLRAACWQAARHGLSRDRRRVRLAG